MGGEEKLIPPACHTMLLSCVGSIVWGHTVTFGIFLAAHKIALSPAVRLTLFGIPPSRPPNSPFAPGPQLSLSGTDHNPLKSFHPCSAPELDVLVTQHRTHACPVLKVASHSIMMCGPQGQEAVP